MDERPHVQSTADENPDELYGSRRCGPAPSSAASNGTWSTSIIRHLRHRPVKLSLIKHHQLRHKRSSSPRPDQITFGHPDITRGMGAGSGCTETGWRGPMPMTCRSKDTGRTGDMATFGSADIGGSRTGLVRFGSSCQFIQRRRAEEQFRARTMNWRR